jgi:hypothetical protein
VKESPEIAQLFSILGAIKEGAKPDGFGFPPIHAS